MIHFGTWAKLHFIFIFKYQSLQNVQRKPKTKYIQNCTPVPTYALHSSVATHLTKLKISELSLTPTPQRSNQRLLILDQKYL